MKHLKRLLSFLMAVTMAFSCAGVAFAADDETMTGEEDIGNDEETGLEVEPIGDIAEEEPAEEYFPSNENDLKEALPEEDVQTIQSEKTTEEDGDIEDNEDAEDYGIATYATTASTSSSSPTSISVDGTSKSYSVNENGSWFKFIISSDGTVKINLNSESGSQLQFMVYSEDDLSNYLTYGKCGGIYSNPGSLTASLSKGTYYIKINYSTTTATLSAKFTSYGVGSTKQNTSYSSPISYTVGEKASGAVTLNNMEVWYKIKVPKKGTYKLKFTCTGSHSPYAYLTNSDQSKYYYGGGLQAGGSDTRTLELSKGTYYLHFEAPSTYDNLSSYTFTLKLKLSKPTVKSATNTSKGVKLKWKKSTGGATGYYVYRKKGSGSYSKIATVKGASTVTYTDKSVKSKYGTTYTYKVTAYYGSSKSTAATKKTVRLKAPSVKSVKSSKSGQVKVKWKKASKGSGYQVQYSTSKSFSSKKTVTVKGRTKTSKKLTGLKKGKTYYVRIRSYKTVSGKKYYSAWSSKKSVKIKK